MKATSLKPSTDISKEDTIFNAFKANLFVINFFVSG